MFLRRYNLQKLLLSSSSNNNKSKTDNLNVVRKGAKGLNRTLICVTQTLNKLVKFILVHHSINLFIQIIILNYSV